MAESLIGLTEGAGKNAHTFQRVIGANTVEDDVVLLGEQYLASYMVTTYSTAIATTTAASHLLQIMAGSSLKVRVRRIEMYQTTAATTAALMDLQVIRLTTAGTGGTTYAVPALDTTDSAAGATAMSIPTVKGTEGNIMWSGGAYLMQTIAASAQLAEPLIVIDFDRLRTKPLIIASGTTNGFCIKNVTGHAGALVRFNVWLDESNF